jgi:hypothetical protein
MLARSCALALSEVTMKTPARTRNLLRMLLLLPSARASLGAHLRFSEGPFFYKDSRSQTHDRDRAKVRLEAERVYNVRTNLWSKTIATGALH